MATSLSNETSSASHVELSSAYLHSGSQNAVFNNQGSNSKSSSSHQKSENQGAYQNHHHSATATSSSNQGVSTSQQKGKQSDQHYSQSAYTSQASGLIQTNSGIGYPFLYPNSIFPGLAQSQSQAQYNYQSAGSASMQSSSSSNQAQNNRRGGKKKAPAAQTQNPEVRMFFNLRRRDSQTQSRGSSHFYKPKNPPSLIEWFKKLSVEERVNALSTVSPHLTETFIIMHQRIDQRGQSTFALRDRNTYIDQKYYQQQYILPYASFPQILTQSPGDSLSPSFDDNFYQRQQNQTELDSIRFNEKDKLNAEQEILKNVRLTHYFEPLDTLTVNDELVQDADAFFTLMASATSNQAFSQTCQFVFDQKTQQNMIEFPHWFKPRSFHSFATWIIVSLEENLWAHYNYDNNINLGSVKANELSSLFREKTDRGAQDVEVADLSKFWREMPDQDKRALINSLQVNAIKEVEQYEASLYHGNGGYQTKSSKNVHSKNMQYSVQIKEKLQEKSNAQIQTEIDLKYYIDQSQRSGFEQDLINQLIYTKFGNTHQRQVLICKIFLDLIKKKYKDDLMENLLLEETVKQNKQDLYFDPLRPHGQGKKKKKKTNQNGQGDKQIPQMQQNESTEMLQESQQPKMKIPKQKKIKQFDECDKSLTGNMSSSDMASRTIANSSNFTMRKKKKGQGQNLKPQQEHDANQGSFTLQQDSYSCDEKDTDKIAASIDIDPEVKSSSQGVSNLYDKTTAHQSNNSNTNSQETISSSVHNTATILQIQSSKSLDLNPVSKSKSYSNSTVKQGKSISKVESKNLQILQSSQNSENGSNHKFKTDKKMKQSTATNACSDNIIFSEDDRQSKKLRNIHDSFNNSESEHENIEVIKQYVLELTNAMITEVCNRAETSQSSISPSRTCDQDPLQRVPDSRDYSEVNQDLYKLSALPESTFVHKKRSFYKKQRKESTNQNQQSHDNLHVSKQQHTGVPQEKRKISFNNQKKCFKDDKKYSEDQTENISNVTYQTAAIGVGSYQAEQVNQHQPDLTNGQRRQRKNFGTNLQSKGEQAAPLNRTAKVTVDAYHIQHQDQKNEWAKGTAKQPDPQVKPNGTNQGRKYQAHRTAPGESVFQTDVERTRQSNTFSQKDLDTLSNSTKDDQSATDSQQQKKKRNKRKGKVNDAAELMNNFMKNLQTSHEEVKHIIEPKSKQDHSNATYKKRNTNNQGQQRNGKPQYYEDSKSQTVKPQGYNSQQQQQQYKQKQQVKNQTAPVKDTSMELVQNPQKPIQEFFVNIDSYKHQDLHEDEKNPEVKHNQAKSYNRVHHKNHQRSQINRQQKRQQAQPQSIVNEDCESVQSNKADCISEKSSKSQNEKVLNNEIQQQQNKQAPFRVLQFTPATDWDNTSLNDLTGTATTNTAADTSMENIQNPMEEAKEHIVIQDQSSHIQVSLTDSIDAKNLLKNNTLAFTLQQFSTKFIHQTMSQTLHEMHEASMIPPQVQSPCSNLSASAQIYTPQSYGHYNQVPQAVPQQFHLAYDFSDQRNQGYQSYQNTPSKSSAQQRNPFKPQNLQLSSQVSQSSHDGPNNLHYRTPPQPSKKANPQPNQSYSNNGMTGGFKKNSNGAQSNANSKQYQVKDYHQPQKLNQAYQPQIQPMAQMMHEPQFIHQFSDPSQTYYHDQSMMMPLQLPLADPYMPKYQSQVFHYDDKSMLQMSNQPSFYPQPHMQQPFTPGVTHQPDIAHNPYIYNEQPMGLQPRKEQSYPMDQMVYKRANQGNFYDQSQDLILQIFNSIKFNQQSLSPIPQMMASPPPLFDLQSSTNSYLDPSSSGPQRIDSYVQMSMENAFYEKLDKEIYSYVQNIQSNLDLLKPERDYVFDKIQSIANKVFEGQKPKLELFGSLITGLALESSDMDLAVTGLYMEDRFAVILELNKLAAPLSNWQVLESFKCIETASIPVIKMKVDILRLREYEMIQQDGSNFESRPVSEQSRYLSIDITFDDSNSQMKQSNFATPTLFYQELMGQTNLTKTHLGLQSCALVQYYIANYQNLKEVSILLKRFLALHNFNSPYYGGLSSYSTVILLVAYMNYFELRQNMNLTPSRLLMGFLDFYGNYFDPNSLGINVYNDGSFYQLNSLQDSNFVILDPLNLQNNTTRNSYLTKEILQKFQCAFNNLKSLTLKNPQLHNAGLSSKPALEKADSQDQNSSIPNERVSPHASDHQTLGHQDWQVGVDQAVNRVPEETEASQLAKGESIDQQSEQQPFSQINLLETFFAGVAQTVAASDGQSSGHQEPMTAMVTLQSAESTKPESLEGQGVSQKV